ncbi:hypothetical protein OKW21_000293 [Catalinimonas alkaloidigena]|uniref:DUF4421 family protein n=1 Tax=Catalinimonas alkaloidigena TaxID=1075417 RepID=UPI0024069BE8|nr:DUF4421 family protein [Catalinimonas alkaloidigena]MDF9795030.1 hypothetical protein [Catalinimonas alkaloidigena]
MNVKALLINRGLNTSLRNVDKGSRIDFAPNNLNYIGVGWYFWGVGVKLHFPLPVSWFYERADIFKSQVIDIRGTLYQKHWLLEGGVQLYQNLYLSEGQTLDDGLNSASETGIQAFRFTSSVTYLFSGEEVSVKAPFNRNNIQLQNAGTWMLTGGFSYINLSGEGSVIPERARNEFANDSTITEVSANSFFIRPGYTYNFVYRNFFLHASGSVGLALQRKNLERVDSDMDKLGVAPLYNFGAAIGYDNGKYFAGISSVFTYGYMQLGNIRLQERARNTELFIGYRFPEPNWIKNNKPRFLNWFTNSK